MEIIFGALALAGRPLERSLPERMAGEAKALIGGSAEISYGGSVALGAVRRPAGARIGQLAEVVSATGGGAATCLLRLRNTAGLRRAAGPAGEAASNDADLLLAAAARRGGGTWKLLEGAFSFAIWDAETGTLTCARDPLGLAPLYHLRLGDTYCFASHLNCLRKLAGRSPELDERALAMRLGLLPADGEFTLFRGIRRLRTGHALSVGPAGASSLRFWAPPAPGGHTDRGDGEWAERCRELFVESVAGSLAPVSATGILLSGGLDSSAIACVAALRASGPLTAASSLLPPDHPGPETDERAFVARVQERIPGLRLLPITAPGAHPFAGLDEYFELHGEPPNSFHYMDAALRDALSGAGVQLALSGFLGDALCSSGRRDAVAELLRAGRPAAAWRAAAALTAAGQMSRLDLFLRQVPLGLIPGPYAALRSRHSLYLAERSGWNRSAAAAPFIARVSHAAAGQPSAAAQILAGMSYGSSTVERDSLAYSLAGVEICFPCWDLRLAELCLAAPPEQFVLGGTRRSLFRRAMAGILPEEIRMRPGKHPYTPDFHARLAGRREQVESGISELARDGAADEFVRGYVDPEKILAGMPRIRRSAGNADWDSRSGELVARGFILLRFLRWFSGL